jgi:hypothetical protein
MHGPNIGFTLLRVKVAKTPRPQKRSPRDEWRKWWDGLASLPGQPFRSLTYRESAALKQLSLQCRWIIKERPKRVLLLLKIYFTNQLETEFTPQEQREIQLLVGEGKVGSSSARDLPAVVTHSDWLKTDFTRSPKRYYLIADPQRLTA